MSQAFSSKNIIPRISGAISDFSLQLTLFQDVDCCAPKDAENTLSISSHDGGGGKYVVIQGRWALQSSEDVNQLSAILKEFVSLPSPNC